MLTWLAVTLAELKAYNVSPNLCDYVQKLEKKFGRKVRDNEWIPLWLWQKSGAPIDAVLQALALCWYRGGREVSLALAAYAEELATELDRASTDVLKRVKGYAETSRSSAQACARHQDYESASEACDHLSMSIGFAVECDRLFFAGPQGSGIRRKNHKALFEKRLFKLLGGFK